MMVEIKKEPSNSNTRRLSFLLVILIIIVGIVCGMFFLGRLLKDNGINTPAQLVSSFLFPGKTDIKSDGGRFNVLILGKAGADNPAPDLTDTIIMVSVSGKRGYVKLFSIPRDIWVPSIRAKINSAYYWGKQNNERNETELVKSLVSGILGQPIYYAVVVDFSGFKEIVDELGGIDINIERDFVDEKYPIAGKENDKCGGDRKFLCRFETVTFVKGVTHMDGETALKFVRSRNAQDEEGTDLAREARQQKVISGIEKEILSVATLANPIKTLNLWRVVRKFVKTDMDESAVAVLTRNILSARKNINSFVFPEELLINPPENQKYDFQYVFVPKEGNWNEIHIWVNSLLQ